MGACGEGGMRGPRRVGYNDEPAGRGPSPGSPLQSQERNKGRHRRDACPDGW